MTRKMKLPKLDLSMQKSCKPPMLGRMWQACRRSLNLEHSPPYQFACCQWQVGHQPSISYIIYRTLIFSLVFSIAISSFVCQRLSKKYTGPKVEYNRFKWFIYLTNWGFSLIVLQSALALAVVLRYKYDKNFSITDEDDETPVALATVRTPMICRAYWLAHTISTDLAFVISLVYWTLVYDPEINDINVLNLAVHGGNSIIMLCELAVTSHPIRMAHALYGAGVGLAYGIFSAIYWAAGGTDKIGLTTIYPALNWNTPGSAISFVAVCAVVLVFVHGAVTWLAAIRGRVARRMHATCAHCDTLTLPTH